MADNVSVSKWIKCFESYIGLALACKRLLLGVASRVRVLQIVRQ